MKLLCIDIGGTSVKLGLLDECGKILSKAEKSVCFDGYRTPVLETVVREAKAFCAGAQIDGVAIAATGQIDSRTGVVVGTNGKIPGYEGARLADTLSAAFGVPACALNDANAAALGERFAGRARGVNDLLLLTLGTGVGGGLVLGGRLYDGARGLAGELGHFTLYQDGPRCPCGKRGCFEHYASTAALVRRAREASGEADLDGRAIFSRAAAGDAAMRAALDTWTGDVAAGLSGLVHIFAPQMALIGGGVCAQEKLFIEPLRARVLASVMPRFAEGLVIERAALGNDAGLIGAACFFLERFC